MRRTPMTTTTARPKARVPRITAAEIAPDGSVSFTLDPEPPPEVLAQIRSQLRLELNTLVRATLTPAQMRTILERAIARTATR
jgi:hypothetical protein